jgi:hypothetical protein
MSEMPIQQNVIAKYRSQSGGAILPVSKRAELRKVRGGREEGHEQWIDLMAERAEQGLDIWTGKKMK